MKVIESLPLIFNCSNSSTFFLISSGHSSHSMHSNSFSIFTTSCKYSSISLSLKISQSWLLLSCLLLSCMQFSNSRLLWLVSYFHLLAYHGYHGYLDFQCFLSCYLLYFLLPIMSKKNAISISFSIASDFFASGKICVSNLACTSFTYL